MEPNYENSTAAAKGCYWNERPFSNENERNTHNSTLPDINLLSTKNGLDFGVHLSALLCVGLLGWLVFRKSEPHTPFDL